MEKCINLCENYNSSAESLALGKIDDIYVDLLNAYRLLDNKHKVVEISVALLKVNKYNVGVLSLLLRTFLTQEKVENIINFMKKLYDYNNIKDKMYLLKASDMVENKKLADYYKKLLNE